MGLTKDQLSKKSVNELKELAEPFIEEDDLKEIKTKAPLIEAILENQAEDDDEVEDDEVEADDEVEEEESDDEPELPEPDEVDEVDEVDEEPTTKKTTKKTKYTEGGKAPNGEKLLGAKEVATAIGTDAKSLRQFFRSGKSSFEPVGAGGRYEFKESDVEGIKKEFDEYKAGKPGRGRGGSGGTGKKRSTRGREVAAEEVIEEVEEIEELEDLDDEISDEDLEIED